MNKRIFILVLIALLIPLFFINVKDSHDWGDDFAQYLLQAENIVEGRPQTETGYVYDKRFPVVAPPAYPAGFPLMLAPVYAVYGHSIYHYELLITLTLFLFCLLMGLYFRRYFSPYASLLLVVAFAWNVWTLYFKTNILSDLPFALFLLAGTMAYTRLQKNRTVVTGLLAGCLLLIRGAGIVFPLAVLIHSGYGWLRKKDSAEGRKQIATGVAIAAIALLLSLGVDRFFHIPSSGFFGFYKDAFTGSSLLAAAGNNLYYYMEVFKAFFQPSIDDWKIIPKTIAWIAFLLLLAGMVRSFLRQRSFEDLLVVCYLALIIIYPYGAGGFRFLLPVVPFLLLYMARCAQWLLQGRLSNSIVITTVWIVLLLTYYPSVEDVIKRRNDIPEGPQREASREMLQEVRRRTRPGEVVMFIKPKALALYARVHTCSTVYTESAEEVDELCKSLGVDYLLKTRDATDAPMEKFIAAYPQKAVLQWQNDRFSLYKLSL